MKQYVIDCTGMQFDCDVWDKYIEIIQPEGACYFGRNLDAFWDAIDGGGPGWPDVCEIEFRGLSKTGLTTLFNGLDAISKEPSRFGVKVIVN